MSRRRGHHLICGVVVFFGQIKRVRPFVGHDTVKKFTFLINVDPVISKSPHLNSNKLILQLIYTVVEKQGEKNGESVK